MSNFNIIVRIILIIHLINLIGWNNLFPEHNTPKNENKVSRWCKIGETPKKNNCQDGSGSGA